MFPNTSTVFSNFVLYLENEISKHYECFLIKSVGVIEQSEFEADCYALD
jgi:hypothetical protein